MKFTASCGSITFMVYPAFDATAKCRMGPHDLPEPKLFLFRFEPEVSVVCGPLLVFVEGLQCLPTDPAHGPVAGFRDCKIGGEIIRVDRVHLRPLQSTLF